MLPSDVKNIPEGFYILKLETITALCYFATRVFVMVTSDVRKTIHKQLAKICTKQYFVLSKKNIPPFAIYVQ